MNEEILINFSIVKNQFGDFFAFMEERLFFSHRFFYMMDESGKHFLVPENRIYKYLSIGKAKCMDAKSICILLRAINSKPELVKDHVKGFIKAVNGYQWKI